MAKLYQNGLDGHILEAGTMLLIEQVHERLERRLYFPAYDPSDVWLEMRRSCLNIGITWQANVETTGPEFQAIFHWRPRSALLIGSKASERAHPWTSITSTAFSPSAAATAAR
jgi:hypothetical protein